MKEDLPEPFQSYWNMKKPFPTEDSFTKNKDRLSKEWNYFIATIRNEVENDFKKENN